MPLKLVDILDIPIRTDGLTRCTNKEKNMNKKGFTLTEILIVLVVAGILLALILPNTLKAIERGNVTALRNDLNTVKVALLMCFTQERNWDSCSTFDNLTGDGRNFLDPEFVANNGLKTPFGVTYQIQADPNGIGGNIACYSGGEDLPAAVTDDVSLIVCGG